MQIDQAKLVIVYYIQADRYVLICAIHNQLVTARWLQYDLQHDAHTPKTEYSGQTVRYRLRNEPMRARSNHTAKLDFSREHHNWQIDEWSTALSSNRFTVSHNDDQMIQA